jgi:hypothetical protein
MHCLHGIASINVGMRKPRDRLELLLVFPGHMHVQRALRRSAPCQYCALTKPLKLLQRWYLRAACITSRRAVSCLLFRGAAHVGPSTQPSRSSAMSDKSPEGPPCNQHSTACAPVSSPSQARKVERAHAMPVAAAALTGSKVRLQRTTSYMTGSLLCLAATVAMA